MLKAVLFCGVDVITTCFILWLSDLTCWADVVAIDFCHWCYCHRLIIDVVVLVDVVPGGDLPLSNCCSGQLNCPG